MVISTISSACLATGVPVRRPPNLVQHRARGGTLVSFYLCKALFPSGQSHPPVRRRHSHTHTVAPKKSSLPNYLPLTPPLRNPFLQTLVWVENKQTKHVQGHASEGLLSPLIICKMEYVFVWALFWGEGLQFISDFQRNPWPKIVQNYWVRRKNDLSFKTKTTYI